MKLKYNNVAYQALKSDVRYIYGAMRPDYKLSASYHQPMKRIFKAICSLSWKRNVRASFRFFCYGNFEEMITASPE